MEKILIQIKIHLMGLKRFTQKITIISKKFMGDNHIKKNTETRIKNKKNKQNFKSKKIKILNSHKLKNTKTCLY